MVSEIPMTLINPLPCGPEPFPIKDYSIGPYLRREAVERAFKIFEQDRIQVIGDGRDDQTNYLGNFEFEWLTETLIQGTYLREYHSWEIEVKSYLNDQRYLNSRLDDFIWKVGKGGNLVDLVRQYLGQFSATVDSETMAVINAMRMRVNKMKHTPTFIAPSRVTKDDYDEATLAIAHFWKQLGMQQNLQVIEVGPHIEKYLKEPWWRSQNSPISGVL